MINAERTGAAGAGTVSTRLTAAMYLRISSEDSDTGHSTKLESDSIANQRSLLSAFISRTPELESADILEFCDDGWSGKILNARLSGKCWNRPEAGISSASW